MELEELQKDSSRLTGRGASKQLKKEEGMSRRIKKELPKLTEWLKVKLTQWEEVDEGCTSHPFKYEDRIYLEVIDESETMWLSYKDGQAKAKAAKKAQARESILPTYNSTKKNPGNSVMGLSRATKARQERGQKTTTVPTATKKAFRERANVVEEETTTEDDSETTIARNGPLSDCAPASGIQVPAPRPSMVGQVEAIDENVP
jgi:hypothetical protein